MQLDKCKKRYGKTREAGQNNVNGSDRMQRDATNIHSRPPSKPRSRSTALLVIRYCVSRLRTNLRTEVVAVQMKKGS